MIRWRKQNWTWSATSWAGRFPTSGSSDSSGRQLVGEKATPAPAPAWKLAKAKETRQSSGDSASARESREETEEKRPQSRRLRLPPPLPALGRTEAPRPRKGRDAAQVALPAHPHTFSRWTASKSNTEVTLPVPVEITNSTQLRSSACFVVHVYLCWWNARGTVVRWKGSRCWYLSLSVLR